jgi:Na+:H+ antiporter, NhaA family
VTTSPNNTTPAVNEPLVDRLLAPFRQFAATASAGGIVLLVATAIALVWANSQWADAYHHIWETPLQAA